MSIANTRTVVVPSYKKYSQLRDKHGLTDYAIHSKTGIATATLSNWKSGQYAPKYDKLLKIASVLNCHIEDLLEEKEGE